MPGRRFDSLLSRLEACGVPHAMSRRIGAELADHFDLLVEEELSRGGDEAAACARAAARLGSDERLFDQFMADARIVPLMRRRPVTAFVLTPIPLVAALLAMYALAAVALVQAVKAWLGIGPGDPAFAVMAAVLFAPAAYGLVAVVAWWFCRAAKAADCPRGWALTACAIIALFGGVLSMRYALPDAQPGSGHLFVGLSNSPHWPRLVLPLAVFAAFVLINRLRMSTNVLR